MAATTGGYLRLQGRWQNGDRVDYELPMSLHVAPTPDDPSLQAVMYRPLVLAGQLGNDDLPQELVYGPLAEGAQQLGIAAVRLQYSACFFNVGPVRRERFARAFARVQL